MTNRGKFVAYYRVSTTRQGKSGLGLDAQRASVESWLNGGATLVASFTEIESGKRNDRPELDKAFATCRVHRATLVVAKLDRLSRNAAFLLKLRDAGVNFVAVDMPDANTVCIGVMAMVAQQEREAISQRTRAALAAAKRRGVVLGTPANLTHRARRAGTRASAATRTARAIERAQDLKATLDDLRRRGFVSLRQLADGLNARDIPAARGGLWTAAQVRRVVVSGLSVTSL